MAKCQIVFFEFVHLLKLLVIRIKKAWFWKLCQLETAIGLAGNLIFNKIFC